MLNHSASDDHTIEDTLLFCRALREQGLLVWRDVNQINQEGQGTIIDKIIEEQRKVMEEQK